MPAGGQELSSIVPALHQGSLHALKVRSPEMGVFGGFRGSECGPTPSRDRRGNLLCKFCLPQRGAKVLVHLGGPREDRIFLLGGEEIEGAWCSSQELSSV